MLKLLYLDIDESLQSGDWIKSFGDGSAFCDDIETVKGNPQTSNYITMDGSGINLIDENKKFYEAGEFKGLYFQSDPGRIVLQPDNIFDFKKGVFIRFYGDCCESINVTYKDAQGDIYEEDIMNPGDMVHIEFHQEYLPLSTQMFIYLFPYRNQKIKISSLIYGKVEVLDDFISSGLTEEANVLSDDLPYNVFKATIVNQNQILKYPIDIYSNGYYGRYYIDSAEKTGQNVYEISAKNEVGRLDDIPYDDWHLTMDLSYFIEKIGSNYGIEITEPTGTSYFTLGYVPVKSARYCLCGLCFACGLMVHNSRQKGITLLPIPTQIVSHIDGERIIGEATFEKSDIITKAEIEYIVGFDLIDKTCEINSTGKSYYADPPIVYVTTSNPNCVIEDSSLNYITFYGASPVTFTIRKAEFTKNVHEIGNINTEAASENEKKYNSFDLIGRVLLSESQAAVYSEFGAPYVYEDIWRDEDIARYIRSTGKVKAKIRMQGEKCGDLITIQTAYNGKKTGIITKMDISFGYEDIADIEVLEWS